MYISEKRCNGQRPLLVKSEDRKTYDEAKTSCNQIPFAYGHLAFIEHPEDLDALIDAKIIDGARDGLFVGVEQLESSANFSKPAGGWHFVKYEQNGTRFVAHEVPMSMNDWLENGKLWRWGEPSNGNRNPVYVENFSAITARGLNDVGGSIMLQYLCQYGKNFAIYRIFPDIESGLL